MILASRLYSGQPNSALSYELDAIAQLYWEAPA